MYEPWHSPRLALIFLAGSLLLVGHAAPAPAQFGACRIRSLPVEDRIVQLAIHPESGTVDYLFAGEIGRAGGRRFLDWSSGAAKTSSWSSVVHPADVLISPSGRLSAHETSAAGKSTIEIGSIDGDAARACGVSAQFHRALGFSIDERFVLATSALGDDHQLLTCDAQSGRVRAWSVVTAAERVREAFRIRFHGRPPWMIDFAQFSPDARRILSGRIDGKVELWTADGRRLDAKMLSSYSPGSMRSRFGFGKDGSVYRLDLAPRDSDARTHYVVSSLFPEAARFEVSHDAHSKAASTLDALQFRATARGLVLLHVTSASIEIVSVPDATSLAEIPTGETVTGLAISVDGAWVAVAHPGHIDLWQLQKSGPCMTDVDLPDSPDR